MVTSVGILPRHSWKEASAHLFCQYFWVMLITMQWPEEGLTASGDCHLEPIYGYFYISVHPDPKAIYLCSLQRRQKNFDLTIPNMPFYWIFFKKEDKLQGKQRLFSSHSDDNITGSISHASLRSRTSSSLTKKERSVLVKVDRKLQWNELSVSYTVGRLALTSTWRNHYCWMDP